ncbi:hypothetical protein AGMMS50225_07460 [Betaproteobacteria bacterium]|nr:hypothetical protein AGMMS50225_07460 [Betaproteobacteria bacterium]
MPAPTARPHILGIRHHSPACARWVASRIRALRPAFVLIEGPADFNDRLDELTLPHRLPIAIYSYLSSDTMHHGSWTPFACHSPEWQALLVGREVGAVVRFIDLPAWHKAFYDLENRYADVIGEEHAARAEAFERALSERLSIQGRDALWDHLFEDETADDLQERLNAYFVRLRGDDPGSEGHQAREQMMAHWIAWAVAEAAKRGDAPTLAVCGGYHAPALERLWRNAPTTLPLTPAPADANGACAGEIRYGSYLTPYTFKRLDAFTGYASGMPSPAWYQWTWEHGAQGAARHALQQLRARLRDKKLSTSTADLMAIHLRAQGLARLRAHAHPLRCDWLDALAGALVKNALDAPLPWSYRGHLRPGTDPALVLVMDILAGDVAGQLAPGTPQPPLVQAVFDELSTLGITLSGTRKLDLHKDADRARSRALHRLAILRLPGVTRVSGPKLALSGGRNEVWQLGQPLEQQAALIEAAAWGATLQDAARARLEDDLRSAQGRIAPLAEGLNQAAWAGLAALSAALINELKTAITNEPRFEALAPALSILHTLYQHGEALEMAHAPVLGVVLEAGFDRALWLLEPAAAIAPADADAHVQGHLALLQIASDALAVDLDIEPARALAVWQRKAADTTSAPLSRGAALGATLRLTYRAENEAGEKTDGTDDALSLLGAMPVGSLGDALSGLLALARELLLADTDFAAGLDTMVRALDNADFVTALPSMREAFAWLPSRERGALAEQVLSLHDATHLSARALTARQQEVAPEDAARARLAEEAALKRLAEWGIGVKRIED